jgi:hypothetical protein
MNHAPARTGWDWFKAGVRLFRRQPGGLITMLFGTIVMSLALSAIPYAGPVLAVILIPSFSMAVMQACWLTEQGQRVTPGVLLTGFRRPAVMALCKLGLVYMAASLLLAGIAELAIDESFWKQITQPIDPKTGPQIDPSQLLTMMLILALEMLTLLALSFTAPLTYWQKMGPIKATFFSVAAVLRDLRAFLTMLLSWFATFFALCVIAVLVIGETSVGRAVVMWVISLFVLLLQCAIYTSYRQIFGPPEPLAPPATPNIDTTA